MAFVQLITHYITSGIPDGVHITGNYIHVLADGATLKTEVWTTSDNSGTLVSTPSGGPVIGTEILVSSSSFNDFQYCDSADLVYYTLKNDWPYIDYHTSVDHPSCAIIVCDLSIDGFTVLNESAVSVADGEITLVSTSSNGTIKYGLTADFDYATGLSSPLTGFTTGNYVIYAKDAAGCTDQVNIFVGIEFNYGVRWRCEYDCVFPEGFSSRIDLEERDYVGAIEETCAGEKPFVLEQIEQDESQLVASNVQIQFLVKRGEEGKFNDIRTGYDRKFLCKKYKNLGSGFVLEWVGYVLAEGYQEPYIHDPYYVNFKAVDGLGDLKNKNFIELSGAEYFGDMSIIDVIAECLKKLPFQLNIRSCVNIFEENMSADVTDDPLAQSYTKSENYRGFKCGDVISDLIKPFTRAQLFQSFGVWWIRTKEQSVYSTLDYREFDKDGVFVDNDTIASRKNADFPTTTNRLCWTEQSQVLSYTRNYGSFKITHDLDKDNNMIDSGGFEESDIDISTEFFRGWQIFPAQTLVTSGLEYVDNGDSKGAFFFQWNPSGSDQADNILSFEPMPIHFLGNVFEQKGATFKLRFQVYIAPAYPVNWIRVGWKLRFTDTDTLDFWDWGIPPSLLSDTPTTNVERINELYISNFGSWQTFEYYGFRAPGDINALNFNVELSFYFHNHQGRDYGSVALLRLEPTLGVLEPGKRVLAVFENRTIGYELQRNVEAEVEPEIIRPADYHAVAFPGTSLNPYQWVKIADYEIDGVVPIVDRIMIDNVKLSIFTLSPNLLVPGFKLIDPPETVVYEQEVSTQNESAFEDDVKNGDAPDMVGYDYIYNGFFKLADGTRTSSWSRSNVSSPGEGEILKNPEFENASAWTNEGSGTSWVFPGVFEEATVTLASGNSKVLTQLITNSFAGDYTFELRRISSNFNIPTDSLNLGVGFFDEFNNPISSAGEFVTGNNDSFINHAFTSVVPVAKIEIIAGMNTGANVDIRVLYATLNGPKSIGESRFLLDIYLIHLAAQGSQSLRVLSGTGIADIQLAFINSLEDQIDDRRYRFKRFNFDDKQGVYDIEIEETLTGADGETPPDPVLISFDSTFYTFDSTAVTFDNT